MTLGKLITTVPNFPKQPITTCRFRFLTDITENSIGEEQRRPNWLEYHSRLELDAIVYENCIEDKLEEFKRFYIEDCRGGLNYFLYKNPLDYLATRKRQYFNDKTYSEAVVSFDSIDTNRDLVVQLNKRYTFNTTSGFKTTYYIDADTLRVWVDNTELARNQYELLDGGRLKLPDVNYTQNIEVEYEFLLPYRLPSELSIQRANAARWVLSRLTLKEVVKANRTPLRALDFNNPLINLDLGFEPTYTETISLQHAQKSTKSERDVVDSRYEANKSKAQLDGTLMTGNEMQALKCAFLACKGRLLTFSHFSREARFDSDELDLSTVVLGDSCTGRFYEPGEVPEDVVTNPGGGGLPGGLPGGGGAA